MQPASFRNSVFTDSKVFGGPYRIPTTVGSVSTNQPPPLPPKPAHLNYSSYETSCRNRYGHPLAGYSGYAHEYNRSSIFGSYGCGAFGGMYGDNAIGNSTFLENRFIQLAEENSRSTFKSVETVVAAVGNIAAMLDSSYFALTSIFRAIIGVAANFTHLRGVFAKFWASFAFFRWIIYVYRNVLYWLGITKLDPTLCNMKEAFNLAENEDWYQQHNKSTLAVLIFLGFIITAPYLLLKIIGGSNFLDQGKNPSLWNNPVEAIVVHSFNATSANELSIRTGQKVLIAPKSIQDSLNLLNTGWVLASLDSKVSGLIPINYIQSTKGQIENEMYY